MSKEEKEKVDELFSKTITPINDLTIAGKQSYLKGLIEHLFVTAIGHGKEDDSEEEHHENLMNWYVSLPLIYPDYLEEACKRTNDLEAWVKHKNYFNKF